MNDREKGTTPAEGCRGGDTVIERSWTLSALTALSVLFSADAEARFGKKSGTAGNASEETSSSEDSKSSSEPHRAEPVNAPPSETAPPSAAPAPTRRTVEVSGAHAGYYSDYSYGWGYGYYPYFAPYGPPPVQGPDVDLIASVGLEGQGRRDGGALGLGLSLEGERLGFNLQFTNILAAADDGSGAVDSIRLFNLHLSYAFLTGPHGRLRLLGGLDGASAPDVTFLGPGLGVSGVFGLINGFALEGMVRLTPYPFRQADTSAGVSFALGPFGLRAGLRRVFLDDRGHVDGVVHADAFSGPYVGVSVSF
jgi:hypothetical protein